jgi:hypothetical protein
MVDSEGCRPYVPLLQQGKPVFHIEYVQYRSTLDGSQVEIRSEDARLKGKSSEELRQILCLEKANGRIKPVGADFGPQFSTVIKVLGLDGFVMYCDGSWAVTTTTPLPADGRPGGSRGTAGLGKSPFWFGAAGARKRSS